MIDYSKLNTLLFKRSENWTSLRKYGISPVTISRMRKGEPVSLSVIEKICNVFQCKIEDVVEIELEPVEEKNT